MQGTDFKPLQFPEQLLISCEIDMQLMSNFNIARGTDELRRKSLDCPLTARPLRRRSRGLQSRVRGLSRIAPRIRNCA
jgi:hypothetical protein